MKFYKNYNKEAKTHEEQNKKANTLSRVQNEGIEGSHLYELSRGSYNYELQI